MWRLLERALFLAKAVSHITNFAINLHQGANRGDFN